jgi:putative restriction endonuclease
VSVEFTEINKKIRPKDHIDLLRPHLPTRYSPIQSNGNGLQSVYLACVPVSMAEVLINLIGPEYTLAISSNETKLLDNPVNDEKLITDLVGRTDIGKTTKDQLILSRRGQGIFKANVRLNEIRCRVTGISDIKHLRASHIKPWRECSDEEKLNGCNGLLLAPHIDHLFDQGYISFGGEGSLILSEKLSAGILKAWNIPSVLNVGAFSENQQKFLKYHRENILK